MQSFSVAELYLMRDAVHDSICFYRDFVSECTNIGIESAASADLCALEAAYRRITDYIDAAQQLSVL